MWQLANELTYISNSLLPQPPPPVSYCQLPDHGGLLMPVNSSLQVMPHAETRVALTPNRRSMATNNNITRQLTARRCRMPVTFILELYFIVCLSIIYGLIALMLRGFSAKVAAS